MSQIIEITEQDIAFAESILLPAEKTFDNERRAFIQNLDTIDLQAVPGSGKTTALLAKLVSLEKKLPFVDGSGILVISHTNAAVDEIKKRIQQFCPNLFSYPNYVGTIQSFVDKFLAIPYYCKITGHKPIRIDNEIFFEQFEKRYPHYLDKNLRIKLSRNYSNFIQSMFVQDGKLVNFYSKEELEINKLGKNTKTFISLIKTKEELLKNGYLNFKDAYAYAFDLIDEHIIIKQFLQNRFKFVFVDEMQDMEQHQYNLLERIFFDSENSISKYQRIGDINQSIYNGDAKDEVYWDNSRTILSITGSTRLSQSMGNIISNFALYQETGFLINGLGNSKIKPCIIKYSTTSIQYVIQTFMNKVIALKQNPNNSLFCHRLQIKNTDCTYKYPIKIIAWTSAPNLTEEGNSDSQIHLIDYYPNYNRFKHQPQIDYDNLWNYLTNINTQQKDFSIIKNKILDAFVKLLRLEKITDLNGRSITKMRLITLIKSKSEEENNNFYNTFIQNLYNWSINFARGRFEEVYNDIKTYCSLLSTFLGGIEVTCSDFFADMTEELTKNVGFNQYNTVYIDGIEAEITSVHSVKGQTHSATLYLESYYYKDGRGENAKSYESERLAEQFLGKPINHLQSGERVKKSAKMVYVGLSRATDFLCIAIHIDRFDKYLSEIDREIWEVIEI